MGLVALDEPRDRVGYTLKTVRADRITPRIAFGQMPGGRSENGEHVRASSGRSPELQ